MHETDVTRGGGYEIKWRGVYFIVLLPLLSTEESFSGVISTKLIPSITSPYRVVMVAKCRIFEHFV